MDDILQAAGDYFQTNSENFNIQVLEEKKGLFGVGAFIKAEVTLNVNPIEEAKEYLVTILQDLQLEGDVLVVEDEAGVTFNISSSDNAFLIGKNGNILLGIQTLTQYLINRYADQPLRIMVDVDSYQVKQIKRLEFLAKKIAKEVILSKTDAKLDPMNAYQRRIIHNTLTKWDNVKTVSEGESPNRRIIIKYQP